MDKRQRIKPLLPSWSPAPENVSDNSVHKRKAERKNVEIYVTTELGLAAMFAQKQGCCHWKFRGEAITIISEESFLVTTASLTLQTASLKPHY